MKLEIEKIVEDSENFHNQKKKRTSKWEMKKIPLPSKLPTKKKVPKKIKKEKPNGKSKQPKIIRKKNFMKQKNKYEQLMGEMNYKETSLFPVKSKIKKKKKLKKKVIVKTTKIVRKVVSNGTRVQCERCGLRVDQSRLDEHLQECDYSDCRYCGNFYPKSLMYQHKR